MPPKSESAGAAGGAGTNGAIAAALEGINASEDEEDSLEIAEEAEFTPSKSKICSDRSKCSARSQWCSDTFKDNIPDDCLEKFAD